MKRQISLILSILILLAALTALPFNSLAGDLPASGSLSDDDSVTYTFNSETGALTISGTGATKDYDSSANPSPFLWNRDITSVVFEPGITKVGSTLLKGCTSLISINFGNTVTEIGNYAFESDSQLTEVNLPDSIVTLGNGAFYQCSKLETVIYGKNVETIGDYCFYNNEKITEFNIPASVKVMPISAIYTCNGVENFVVEEGNSEFSSKDGVLYSIDGKTLIKYPNGKNSTTFTVPENVTALGSSSLAYNKYLEEINIGDNVTSIGSYAFRANTNLKKVNIGKNAAEIGNAPFFDSLALESITVSEGNSHFYSTDGIFYSKDNNSLIAYPPAKTGDSLEIPKSIKGITNNAFYMTKYLKSVTFESGTAIEEIGENSFYHAESLESIVLPVTVKSIGDYAFYYCKKLKTLVIPNPECEIYGLSSLNRVSGAVPINIYSYNLCDGSDSKVKKFLDTNAETLSAISEYSYESLGTAEHSYSPGTVTAQPTCTKNGAQIMVCSKCAKLENVIIPALGHTWNAGTVTKKATVKAAGVKTYTCTVCKATKTEAIAKNNFTVKAKKATVKFSKLSRKNQTVKRAKAVTVKNAKGKVSYKIAKKNKNFTVAKNGKITVKKGLKKGTYKIKIKVTAAGNADYAKAAKTVTVTIVVK